MFQQIIKIIWSQRKANAWIWAEMVLVSVCLWYITDDLYTRASLYFSPKGYDIADVYVIDLRTLTDKNEQYRPQEDYGTTLGEDLLTLINRMRSYPGVEAVGISLAALPYSYSRDYSNMVRINYETNDTLNAGDLRRINATPDYVRVFRYTTPEGNTEVLAENLKFNTRLITTETADRLFPEGNATGKLISYQSDSTEMRVGGVMAPVRFGDFDTYSPTYIRLLPENVIASDLDLFAFGRLDITLRANPSTGKAFAANFRKEMRSQLRYHNIYLLNIRSYDDIRARYIRSDLNETKMYLAAVFFLLVNIFFGVVGTFWFRTQHRMGEMGLRIALGSTTGNLRGLLIGEGLLILLFAALPAACIAFNIGFVEIVNVEIMPFTLARFLFCQSITFVLMVLMITVGIWFPSRKVIHLQPAEALHYE